MTDEGHGAPPERAATQLFLPKHSPLPALAPPAQIPVRQSQVLDLLDRVAALDAEVLITGPFGAGKEMCAHYLHRRSHRADRAFVPVSCAQERQDLIENELFGGSAGAPNGGLIAKAEGGTLFLDEVDLLPLGAQVKLLRFLQEKEYRPLGGTRLQRANVRIIVAASADPAGAPGEKPLLRALLSRLGTTEVELPALAGRGEEIPFLLEAFAAGCATHPLPGAAPGVRADDRLTGASGPASSASSKTA